MWMMAQLGIAIMTSPNLSGFPDRKCHLHHLQMVLPWERNDISRWTWQRLLRCASLWNYRDTGHLCFLAGTQSRLYSPVINLAMNIQLSLAHSTCCEGHLPSLTVSAWFHSWKLTWKPWNRHDKGFDPSFFWTLSKKARHRRPHEL